jgi:hypothetical protein
MANQQKRTAPDHRTEDGQPCSLNNRKRARLDVVRENNNGQGSSRDHEIACHVGSLYADESDSDSSQREQLEAGNGSDAFSDGTDAHEGMGSDFTVDDDDDGRSAGAESDEFLDDDDALDELYEQVNDELSEDPDAEMGHVVSQVLESIKRANEVEVRLICCRHSLFL